MAFCFMRTGRIDRQLAKHAPVVINFRPWSRKYIVYRSGCGLIRDRIGSLNNGYASVVYARNAKTCHKASPAS